MADPLIIGALISGIFAGIVSVLAMIKTSKCCGCQVETREAIQNNENTTEY